MKGRKTGYILLVFVCTFLLSDTMPVFANNNEQWVSSYDNESKLYLENTITGERVVQAFQYDETGNIIEKDLIEYMNELNYEHKNLQKYSKFDISIKTPDTYEIHDFYNTKEYKITGKATKISADVYGGKNGGTVNVTNSISTTQVFSRAISSIGELSKQIRATASFTWNKSSTSAESYGAGFSVKPYETAYITFSPYFNKIEGSVAKKTYSMSGYLIKTDELGVKYGLSPIELKNGLTDGVFALVVK